MTSFSQPFYILFKNVVFQIILVRAVAWKHSFCTQTNSLNKLYTTDIPLTKCLYWSSCLRIFIRFLKFYFGLCWDFHHDYIRVQSNFALLEHIFFDKLSNFYSISTTTVTVLYHITISVGYFDWQNNSNSQTHLTWRHPVADTILIYPNLFASTPNIRASIFD